MSTLQFCLAAAAVVVVLAVLVSRPGRRRLRALATGVIGEIQWKPPGWLSRAFAHAALRRRSYAPAALALLVVAGSIGGYQVWRKAQPKPDVMAVTPELVNGATLANGLILQPLNLRFDRSARPIDRTAGAPMPQLSPARDGTWMWQNDNLLTFDSRTPWPAATKYTVTFPAGAIAKTAELATRDVNFTTKPFEVKFKDLHVDINEDTGEKRIIGDLVASHVIDAAEVQRKLSAIVRGEENLFSPKPGEPIVKVTPTDKPWLFTVTSAPMRLPKDGTFFTLTTAPSLRPPNDGGASEGKEFTTELSIPSEDSFFKVKEVKTQIVRDVDDMARQVLFVNFTAGVKPADLAKYLEVLCLPAPAAGADEITDADTVPEAILAKAEKLKPIADVTMEDPTATDEENKKKKAPEMQSFRFEAPEDRKLLVRIKKDLPAVGGFSLRDGYATLLDVPVYPREVAFANKGGVLALQGERKITVSSRGVSSLLYRVGRVLPGEINHLVSQSEGSFESPVFLNRDFDEQDLSEPFTKEEHLDASDPNKLAYAALDLTPFLTAPSASTNPAAAIPAPKSKLRHGLFFLTVQQKPEPVEDGTPKSKLSAEDDDGSGDDPNITIKEDTDHSAYVARSVDHHAEKLPSDKRFVLVTDMGLIAKTNRDGSRDVFITSLAQRQPVIGATVDILGKNGVAVATAVTDKDGRAHLPPLGILEREHRPVAIVAHKDDDLSFLPMMRTDRKLDFSRFAIDGITTPAPDAIEASLFSDRGIYRPGDTIHVGFMVKTHDWKGQVAGIPLHADVIDPRGDTVLTKIITLEHAGLHDWTFNFADTAPTGPYNIRLHLQGPQATPGTVIASTTVKVDEFLPDRMKIRTSVVKNPASTNTTTATTTPAPAAKVAPAWWRPGDVSFDVDVINLTGTPAADRKVEGNLLIEPATIRVQGFEGYTFANADLAPQDDGSRWDEVDLAATATDADGHVNVTPELKPYVLQGVHQMTYVLRAFEPEGGRNVADGSNITLCDRDWIVGWKPAGNVKLDTIAKASPAALNLQAINPARQAIDAGPVKVTIVERRPVAILTKRSDGNYSYETSFRESEVSTTDVPLASTGATFNLPTDHPGDFIVRGFDTTGATVFRSGFRVVGTGELSHPLERDAELQANLDKQKYMPGETISIALTAPYAGSGLITIERDKVYASAWFHADSPSSVQTITVPPGFEGTGYVNIAFVRAMDSPEVLTAPLSYSVMPFESNRAAHVAEVKIEVPERVLPGKNLTVRMSGGKPGRAIVYAVDEGILQVARYTLPDPLSDFFQRCALNVKTAQIVDQLLPEYSLARRMASVGGGGRPDLVAGNLNPFKRKGEPPLAFWSGVITTTGAPQDITVPIPDYFNGRVRVMAVCEGDEQIGASQQFVTARSPIIIMPNAPVVVAPGDEFEVTVGLTNLLGEAEEPAAKTREITPAATSAPIEEDIVLRAALSPELSPRSAIGGDATAESTQTLRIKRGGEKIAHFRLKANDLLGDASIKFTASSGNVTRQREAHLSVRPPSAFASHAQGGVLKPTVLSGTETFNLEHSFYPQYRQQEVVLTTTPLGLAHGLAVYLQNYPHMCSEQMSSCGLAMVGLADEPEIDITRAQSEKILANMIRILRSRQNAAGVFGLYNQTAGKAEELDALSLQVMRVLCEAREAGYAVPTDVMNLGLGHLESMAAATPSSLIEARTQAEAIYLLTRQGKVMTNGLDRWREYVQANYEKEWPQDVAALYGAGAYAALRNNDEAGKMVKAFDLRSDPRNGKYEEDYMSPLARNAIAVTIFARHFPARYKALTNAEWNTVLAPISRGWYTTHSAGLSAIALRAGAKLWNADGKPAARVTEVDASGHEKAIELTGASVRRGQLSLNATAVRITSTGDLQHPGPPIYYQVLERGFDRTTPTEAVAKGLEITRDLLNADGKTVTEAKMGDELTLRLRWRALDNREVSNIAITDVLPGGCEVTPESLASGPSSQSGLEYIDVREDRVVLYGTAAATTQELTYKVRVTNRGLYTVPAPQIEAMYHPELYARGVGRKLNVEAEKQVAAK